jgi:hypothetical protein
MPSKVTDEATEFAVIDRWDGGVGWVAHPEETMQRASHALATDEGVWVVDPVDADGIDDLLAEFGEVRGVVVLSNHHLRDAPAVAARHDVPVYLPTRMTGVAERIDGPVGRIENGATLGEYELLEVAHSDSDFWQEFALFDGETLVCSESVGGAPYFRVGNERLGVMTMRRLSPPRDALGDLEPERVFSGHGAGVQTEATPALRRALRTSRRRFPKALLANGRKQLGTLAAALRT